MSQAGLSLHPEKTRGSPVPRPPLFPSAASVVDMTAPTSHFDFLGYRFWRSRKEELGVRRLISPKSEGKRRAKLKPLTRRANGASMAAIVAKLRPVLRGWDGYFQHASAAHLQASGDPAAHQRRAGPEPPGDLDLIGSPSFWRSIAAQAGRQRLDATGGTAPKANPGTPGGLSPRLVSISSRSSCTGCILLLQCRRQDRSTNRAPRALIPANPMHFERLQVSGLRGVADGGF